MSADLAPGDPVAIGTGLDTRGGVVQRVTAQQVLVPIPPQAPPVRYRRTDWCPVGSPRGETKRKLRRATRHDELQMRAELVRRQLRAVRIALRDRPRPWT